MKLLFGCGYLGSRVAALWQLAGEEVVVVTRCRDRAAQLESQGFTAVVANVMQPQSLQDLPSAETVLFAVGFDRSDGQSISDVYVSGVRHVLDSLPATTGRFIYISSTGVYGPADGQWIDESTATNPQREGGKASLAAERVLQAHPLGRRGVVLRLAGIYGPGRVPFLDRLIAGAPIPAPMEGNLNLIYVDDAAACVLAAERKSMSSAGPWICCVSDGSPVPRAEFYGAIAQTLGAPEARFSAPDPDSPRLARAAADKRVDNSRMVSELRVRLSCPSYREGLMKILRNNGRGPMAG